MKTVLLVEDDISIATIYKFKFEASGYNVVHGLNGLEGLAAVANERPDIILLDLMMPIMNGEQFLHKLRKNQDYADIPVLVLTNVSREEAPKTLWHYGISDYFVKANHTPNELVKIVATYIS